MTGVLLMSYGAAQSRDDLLRYYTHIRHGLPPSDEQLRDLTLRYDAIGGQSPLTLITKRQVAGLQAALDGACPGQFQVFLGMKHSPPFIADGVAAIHEANLKRFVGLVLAPHYSSMSVGDYFQEITQALQSYNPSPKFFGIRSWHMDPGLIRLLAQRLRESMALFSPEEREDLVVVFSAHSLPQRILAQGDPYPAQLRQTGELVAEQAGISRYIYSWQSAGRTREPWMGPDILETLSSLHTEGYNHVLVAPVGFVADHLEVLYDLDIQAQQHAKGLGMHIERTASFNDDPAFLQMLASVVCKHAEQME
ncbi:ferrochelatase [Sulfobacillus sp. hq2]|uniref:ferrochelatase n=1 Tax=Sulfobacillus TaxID=28033 RepID=UPI001FA89EFF|nr:ferrochelatase [Sulfobacillus sp. hq2]